MEIPLCISLIITEPMVFFCHRMILMPEIPYSEKEMDNVIKYAKENTGYEPLVVDGINKMLQGVTTLEEVNKKVILY